MNPYEKCPVYENENYLLRFIDASDAPDLLLVYSDEKAVPYFNSDNCGGDTFHYTTIKRMQEAIEYWQWEYQRQGFVRWTVIDKNTRRAIGTIELFHRRSDDHFNSCGLLRLDLRSDYEYEKNVSEILALIVPPAFELFDCQTVATKIPPFAHERRRAAEKSGFTRSEEPLIGGHDRKIYTDYYEKTISGGSNAGDISMPSIQPPVH